MSEGTGGETADATEGGGRTIFSEETVEGNITVSMAEDAVSVRFSGTVKDFSGNPVPGVRISVLSDEETVGSGETDRHGTYSIGYRACLMDYVHILRAVPPEDTPYADYAEEISFREDGSVVRDIRLAHSQPSTIWGQVCDSRDSRPISGAHVVAYSRSTFWANETETRDDGIYQFTSLPEAWDYVVIAETDGYVTQRKTGLSDGSTVSFRLESLSGSITGYVRDAGGTGMKSALVEIRSETSYFRKSVLTDEDGYYEIRNLPTYGYYEVTAEKPGYAPASEGQRRAGDSVTLTLDAGGKITGTVRLSDGTALPAGTTVIIKVFRKGFQGCVGTASADDRGNFSITGLASGMKYELKFSRFGTDTRQWVGRGGIGTGKREDAEAYSAGATVNFRFGSTK